MTKIIEWLARMLKWDTMPSTDNELKVPVAPPVSPKLPVSAPQTMDTTNTMLEKFCNAITNFEGGSTDPNHINNNPGDFRCSPVGYLPKYGNVKCSKAGFAVFPTFPLGWEYLLESVHYRAVAHPTWTILDFFNNYAPSDDKNDPAHYAEVVAGECGVPVNITLAQLLGIV